MRLPHICQARCHRHDPDMFRRRACAAPPPSSQLHRLPDLQAEPRLLGDTVGAMAYANMPLQCACIDAALLPPGSI